MQKGSWGFEEVEHTADWELRVWAVDMAALLQAAAVGMYSLAGVKLMPAPRVNRAFSLAVTELETLLVEFLAELLYFSEMDGLGFDKYTLLVGENSLQAALEGAPISSMEKEIKAVTYHKLEINKTRQGYETNVVFDV